MIRANKLPGIIQAGDKIARFVGVTVGGVDVTKDTLKVNLTQKTATLCMRDNAGNMIVDEYYNQASVEYTRGVEVIVKDGAPEWVDEALKEIEKEKIYEIER